MLRNLLFWVVSGTAVGLLASTSALAQVAVDTKPPVLLAQITSAPPSRSDSSISLPPPRISDYWMSISLQPGGVLVFDGYAPDAATRDRFAEVSGADVNWLKLGSGAPAQYQQATELGLTLLSKLSEGRFALRANVVTISGIAATPGDYDAVQSVLAAGAPAGVVLAMAEIRPPAGAEANVAAYGWSAVKQAGGQVEIGGMVPSAAVQQDLAGRVSTALTDKSQINAAAPEGFAAQAERAVAILDLLSEGQVAFDGTMWSVTGKGQEVDSIAAIATILGTGASAWNVNVTPAPVVAVAPSEPVEPVTPPAETPATPQQSTPASTESEAPAAPAVVEQTPAPAAVSPPASSASNIALCRDEVNALSAQNAILFQSGAAVLAPGAAPVLDSFATSLNLCPDAVIHIEGHTDSDGDDQRNLVLSVSRAEAVVNALIQRGVSPDRLYAIGYGESQPVASNDTQDGKRRNRRIVVSVLEEHE